MFSQEHHTESLSICQGVIEKIESMVYTIVGICRKEGVTMIFVRLNHLMSNKRLKIADVCKDTKISRPTLTALYYGTSKGMNFDTINKLCSYFRCSIEELLYFYDVELDTVEISYFDESQRPNKDSKDYLPDELQDQYPDMFKGEIRLKSSVATIGRVPFALDCNEFHFDDTDASEIGITLKTGPVPLPYLPNDLRDDFARNLVNIMVSRINKQYPGALPTKDFSINYNFSFNDK